jgi:hypothetical protein
MFQPEEVKRDEYGFWLHSALARLPEDVSLTKQPETIDMEFFFVSFDSDAPAEMRGQYKRATWSDGYKWGEILRGWQPEPPGGDEWFLAAIYDSVVDGYYACFTRPLSNQTE